MWLRVESSWGCLRVSCAKPRNSRRRNFRVGAGNRGGSRAYSSSTPQTADSLYNLSSNPIYAVTHQRPRCRKTSDGRLRRNYPGTTLAGLPLAVSWLEQNHHRIALKRLRGSSASTFMQALISAILDIITVSSQAVFSPRSYASLRHINKLQ